MSGAPIEVPAPRPPQRLTRRGWVLLYTTLAAVGFAAGLLWPYAVVSS